MREYKDTFIKPDSERDVLFVFGAGASIAEGAPLQRDILKLIFESSEEDLTSSNAANEVRHFIQDNFYISNGSYPSLEAVFG